MKPVHALLAAAALGAASLAAAAPAPASRSTAVEAGDLDLGSDQGQRILALRIQRAARGLCKPQAVASLPRSIRSERSCIRAARASAAAAVKAMTAAGDPASDMGG